MIVTVPQIILMGYSIKLKLVLTRKLFKKNYRNTPVSGIGIGIYVKAVTYTG
jgi:hypothetical protein